MGFFLILGATMFSGFSHFMEEGCQGLDVEDKRAIDRKGGFSNTKKLAKTMISTTNMDII